MANGTVTRYDTQDFSWKVSYLLTIPPVSSPEQFRVLRKKGTERPGTGEYNKHTVSGVYTCAGCDAPLYKSTTKFNSGCGWPAFFEGIPGAIIRHEDRSLGTTRTEIVCKNCGGHLG